MPTLPTPPGELGQLVKELRQLPEEALLQAWKTNSEELAALGHDPHSSRRSHQLRLRHYAFRLAAIEQFGAQEHVTRYRSVMRR